MESQTNEIFVHPQCPDCTGVIEQFNADPSQFDGAELLDVTDIRNLKKFLIYRDNLPGYGDVVKQGKIGVPSKVIGGETVEFETIVESTGLSEL